MISVLSTKILAPEQRNRLIEKGFSLTEFDFITTQCKEFELKSVGNLLLFTSQNAVKSVLRHQKKNILKKIPVVCVGEKTAELLTKNGWQVVHYEDYAEKLGNYIKKNHLKDNITFFCGNLRRNTLPNLLKESNIPFDEIEVYQTILSSQKIKLPQTAILFFSPSGVKSYISKNDISDEICFCIGETTANEALKHSQNCILSNQPTVDSLLEKCISHFQ